MPGPRNTAVFSETLVHINPSTAEVLNLFCLVYPLPNEKSKIYTILLVAPCDKCKASFFVLFTTANIKKSVFSKRRRDCF